MSFVDVEKRPGISVIVPVYNAQRTLPRMVGCILDQTFSDFELLLIDDGSTDGSLVLCRKLSQKDARIRVFESIHSGPAVTRNLGIMKSRGRYLAFFDADDYVELDMLEELYTSAITTKSDLVVCGYFVEGYRQEVLTYSQPIFLPDTIVYTNPEVKKYVIRAFQGPLFYSPCNKLYRKDIIIRESLYMPPGIDLGEDMLFNLQYLANVNTMSVMQHCLYHYIQHEDGSLTTKFHENKADIMANWMDGIYQFAEDVCVNDRPIMDMLIWLKIRWAYSYYVSLAGGRFGKEEILKYIRESYEKFDFTSLRVLHKQGIRKYWLSRIANSKNTYLIYYLAKIIRLAKVRFGAIYRLFQTWRV